MDLGGVGKEFAVDAVRQIGVNHGLPRLLVDFGGDVAVHGESPEGGGGYVGLEDPEIIGSAYQGVRISSGMAVATSGDYRRNFVFKGNRYGHLLDCRTGCPVSHKTRTVSVIARRCVEAGIHSTAAMIRGGRAGLEALERVTGVEGCLWDAGQILQTRGFSRYVADAVRLTANRTRK
jgi:thiamine biosynthesis lipoprotein